MTVVPSPTVSRWRHCDSCTFTYSFKVAHFETLKTMRANEKCSGMTFIKVDICQRMGPLRMLYSMTLTYIFKVNHFKWLFWHVNASDGKCGIWCQCCTISLKEWCHCQCCTFSLKEWCHCQCCTFSLKEWCPCQCCTFSLKLKHFLICSGYKKCTDKQMSPAHLPRFALPPPWNCSR